MILATMYACVEVEISTGTRYRGGSEEGVGWGEGGEVWGESGGWGRVGRGVECLWSS